MPFPRLWWGLCPLWAVLAFVFQPAVSAEQERPNVLFILVDDMGWKDLGSYGHEVIKTPNIDKLAGEGMRFTNAYAAGENK